MSKPSQSRTLAGNDVAGKEGQKIFRHGRRLPLTSRGLIRVGRIDEGRVRPGFSQVEDCEVLSPWADGVLITFRQGFCDLMKVIQVVDNPCCQEMFQTHSAQGWMLCLAVKLGGPEAQASDERQALLTELGELGEQLQRISIGWFGLLGKLMEGRELADRAFRKNDANPGYPVRPFVVDEMDEDGVGTPSVRILPEMQPGLRQSVKEGSQDRRSCLEQGESFSQVKGVRFGFGVHRFTSFVGALLQFTEHKGSALEFNNWESLA